jgi:diacylglycerol kinase
MRINWDCPQTRPGLLGAIDKFIGPGATRSEIFLQTCIPVVAAVAALWYVNTLTLNWSLLQQCICAVIAIDTVGGIITNATSTAKRWYHRSGQSVKDHLSFILLHFIQLFLVSWLYLSMDWSWVAISGGYLIIAAVIILNTELYLQRPVAMILYAIALVLSLYVFKHPVGLEWFLPLFYTKLLVSHLPQEEPYRPEAER